MTASTNFTLSDVASHRLELHKMYKLRPINDAEAGWFTFSPLEWVPQQACWRGQSLTGHTLIIYAKEMLDLDVVEIDREQRAKCDCGAKAARTTHAMWCSTMVAEQP